jgi:hypothetical protein
MKMTQETDILKREKRYSLRAGTWSEMARMSPSRRDLAASSARSTRSLERFFHQVADQPLKALAPHPLGH